MKRLQCSTDNYDINEEHDKKNRNNRITSSSFNRRHSSHPPSHFFFILLTATSLFPAHSGRAPAPHCIGDNGVLGGSVPCQSQSHTVPNEPSPTTLRGVQDRIDAIKKDEEKLVRINPNG